MPRQREMRALQVESVAESEANTASPSEFSLDGADRRLSATAASAPLVSEIIPPSSRPVAVASRELPLLRPGCPLAPALASL
jgi:hypothetical protein